MAELATLLAVLLSMGLAAAVIVGRHLLRRARERDDLSPVTRQHIELFQGGQLDQRALDSAKLRMRRLLERGGWEAVEANMRPGMHYVVQVRALAEIGTDEAGQILERQLERRLTDDQVEQLWYWIDVAGSLRALNREQSLPHLLRCADKAGDIPLGHFFAAETVCFLGFSGFLRQPNTAAGRAAQRVLHRALEGLRWGVPPHLVAEARLGEAVEQLWDHCAHQVGPLPVRVFSEALRLLRRAPHAERMLTEERFEQEAFQMQISRLAALEPSLVSYLEEAPAALCAAIPGAAKREQRDLLSALADLRAEAAPVLLPLLELPRFPNMEQAAEVLAWSRDPRVGLCLRDWAVRHVPVVQRAQQRRQAHSPSRRSLPAHVPYAAILHALRGHPSRETESFLLLAARDWDPTYRAAAIGSLGWWEPVYRVEVLLTLQQARHDPNTDVRHYARAALARLGERQALQSFRQLLGSDEPQRVHEAIQFIAHEGLTLLWSDLDKLADSEDADVNYHAREALERLCEDLAVRKR